MLNSAPGRRLVPAGEGAGLQRRAVAVSGRCPAQKCAKRKVVTVYSASASSPAVSSVQPSLFTTQPVPSDRTPVNNTAPQTQSEPIQNLTRLAAANQSCQVLEALSKTALLLRDQAVDQKLDHATLQALFQNGYDTLVALLQALPMCPGAYSPAAVIPETCITLFHIHNVLLSAAYASDQDLDVYTELIQAGLGLYLLKAPRSSGFSCSNGQLDAILDALAHQSHWNFQRLLWLRMLPSIAKWDSMQDFMSVIDSCELHAQSAAVAAAAAAPSASPSDSAAAAEVRSGASTAIASSSSSSRSMAGKPAYTSYAVYADEGAPEVAASPLATAFNKIADAERASSGSSTSTSGRGSGSGYDKRAEHDEYLCLMSECIRAAFDGAAARGLATAEQPYQAARDLLDTAAAFDKRQRATSTPPALRYTFIPNPTWLSQVAAAGVEARLVPMSINPEQTIQLLRDLDALAPKPLEPHGAANRWMDAKGQAAVEGAVLRHTASHAWTEEQALQVLQVLAGKCRSPPSDALCVLVEGLLFTCAEAKDDLGFLCTLLQDACDLVDARGAAALSPAHMSMVRVALNRAICLVGSASNEGTAIFPTTPAGSSSSGTGAGVPSWRNRDFMFNSYPRLLAAARTFDYPLQAFRLDEYAAELYNHLAAQPGHELVAVGPEGLTRALAAVAGTPCCRDPQFAAAFERACLNVVSVQFAVGYTHPKRWLGLLKRTAEELHFPMPDLAASVKAMMVRLCDSRRHTSYFWDMLPLVGALERRAAEAVGKPQAADAPAVGWTPVADLPTSGSVRGSAAATSARYVTGATAAPGRRGSPGSKSSSASGRRPLGTQSTAISSGTSSTISSNASSQRAIIPPPDLSRYLVNEDEFATWCEELGQRLALHMAMATDKDRAAQLSMLGISSM
ncbi:hypothetical protein HYH02_005333 [Chlamydomonas schloesseri]|uniref:Uncharacterized protein n=1 Tax=Chlamydomonas schloesseri TaxID=2026947 RepID=A0A836B7I2_9CHLO|nr:hypothetical protein HYH02_005333 [Chlamydomonas schloesseri]|eukprot:KAG2449810.1 hypothetical protein HYH02_005333 [Chlamydomonas schloesseri]